MFSFTTVKHHKAIYGLLGWVLSLALANVLPVQDDLLSTIPIGFVRTAEGASCAELSDAQGLEACRQVLQRDPTNVDIRVALSDGLVQLHRYAEAVQILRQGLELNPGATVIKQKLSLAESYLQEQLWIEKQRKQRARQGENTNASGDNVAERRYIIRCTRLEGAEALRACDEGLHKFPHNVDLLAGKGDVLAGLKQYGNAVAAYQAALQIGAKKDQISRKLQLVQAKRRISVKKCRLLEGQRALEACDAVLFSGAEDEFDLRSRKGDLLLGLGRTQDAVRSYQSALGLRPNDRDIRRKLAALDGLRGSEDGSLQKSALPVPATAHAPPAKVVARAEPASAVKPPAVSPPRKQQKPAPTKVSPVRPLRAPSSATPEKRSVASTAERALPQSPQPPAAKFSNAPVMTGVTH